METDRFSRTAQTQEGDCKLAHAGCTANEESTKYWVIGLLSVCFSKSHVSHVNVTWQSALSVADVAGYECIRQCFVKGEDKHKALGHVTWTPRPDISVSALADVYS